MGKSKINNMNHYIAFPKKGFSFYFIGDIDDIKSDLRYYSKLSIDKEILNAREFMLNCSEHETTLDTSAKD